MAGSCDHDDCHAPHGGGQGSLLGAAAMGVVWNARGGTLLGLIAPVRGPVDLALLR